MSKTILSRDEKARLLVANGAVTLRPGTGTALVRGSNGEEYVVTKTSCSCPDFARRGLDCKHRIAAREICCLYRQCARQARETGRVTIPPQLGWALGMYRDVEAQPPAPACRRHGEPLPCTGCDWEKFERDLVTRCMTCGSRLVDGYCPREAAERKAAA